MIACPSRGIAHSARGNDVTAGERISCRGAYLSHFHLVLLSYFHCNSASALSCTSPGRDPIVYLSSRQPFYARHASRRAASIFFSLPPRDPSDPRIGSALCPDPHSISKLAEKHGPAATRPDFALARARARAICSIRPFINSFDWMDKAPR